MLSDEQVWWRRRGNSNSVGNLVLHLEGNVRQWIISGLGGAPDCRERDKEFAARGPTARRALLMRLRRTVQKACRALAKLTPRDLAHERVTQGFRVTGLNAVLHVTEHFAHHTGQIIFATKLLSGKDLKFTRLPGEKQRKSPAQNLPAI